MNILLVAIGGSIGSILRFYISVMFDKRPIGTWLANITGSIILAFTLYYYHIDALSPSLWLLLGVGFCGSYTTFSTFGYEVIRMIINKDYKTASLYIISSVFTSILAVSIIWHFLRYPF